MIELTRSAPLCVREEPGVGHENLVLKYGKTLRFTGFLGVRTSLADRAPFSLTC